MTDTLSGAELGKKTSAEMALRYVSDGMKLGLGSGSTAEWFVKLLAARVRDGLSVTCAATSRRTAQLAVEQGITLRSLDDLGRLDLTIDGADEIDPALNLIKGGGGCHLVEKIVAAASDDLIVIADDRKLVPALGAFPLPVEVVTYGWQTTAKMIEDIFRSANIKDPQGTRRIKDDIPFLTDEGNFILDYPLGEAGDPEVLARVLNTIPGVVENGLFVGMASRAMIGTADGTAREVLPR